MRIASLAVAALAGLLLLPGCSDTDPAQGSGGQGARPGAVSDILLKGTKLYSQFNEELIIRDFFQDRRGGTFLDVGSGHYMNLSTTYYLEKHLGWSGIAVDALPEYGAGYAKHRPRTRFFARLVSSASGKKMAFFRTPAMTELSSVDRAVAERQTAEVTGNPAVEKLSFETVTLNDLLEGLRVERIDFLSMDIEEHEPAALAGFDIRRFRPRLVCIEAHPSVQKELLAYFARNDYVLLEKYLPFDAYNLYFTPRPAQAP
ncbi:MAG: FkbM family methyltransferase [Elusimicrobia bacterium]|nr:FkbM family methyltransferase [Elusimicrobiota bacterium]